MQQALQSSDQYKRSYLQSPMIYSNILYMEQVIYRVLLGLSLNPWFGVIVINPNQEWDPYFHIYIVVLGTGKYCNYCLCNHFHFISQQLLHHIVFVELTGCPWKRISLMTR